MSEFSTHDIITRAIEHQRTSRPHKTPEKAIQEKIIRALTDLDIYHWRQNAGTMVRDGRRIQFGGVLGMADILALLPPDGRFLAIEVKAPGGRQTPNQVRFQKHIEENGGLYLLVHSFEEFREKFREALFK